MLPKAPPRTGQVGFVYVPPYRVQGISVAGEQTVVQIPELDIAFDIGLCPRPALASPYVAISHGHMDHVAGLPYYFSQRIFQKMTPGKCICHARIAPAIQKMMAGWADLEQQHTPHEIIPLEPDEQIEIKPNILCRGIEVSHTVPSMGYAIIERRNKLKEELRDLPQEKLRELREKGEDITNQFEIPLVAYTGDTEMGPFLFRDEFALAKIVITECTFFDDDHKSRAQMGKHLHAKDIAQLLAVWQAESVVLIHVSRRTHLAAAQEQLNSLLGEEQAARVLFLMDHRTNKNRYEGQCIMAETARV